jgi:hypothetical protein
MTCCHSRTDSPNDAASESKTVPTITKAAMAARVMISMMMKIRQSAETAAMMRS